MRSNYLDRKEQNAFADWIMSKVNNLETDIDNLVLKNLRAKNKSIRKLIVGYRSRCASLESISRTVRSMDASVFQESKHILAKTSLTTDYSSHAALHRASLLGTHLDQLEFSKKTRRFLFNQGYRKVDNLRKLKRSLLSTADQETINNVDAFMKAYKIPYRGISIFFAKDQPKKAVIFLKKIWHEHTCSYELKKFFDFLKEDLNIRNLYDLKMKIEESIYSEPFSFLIIDYERDYTKKGTNELFGNYLLLNGVLLEEETVKT